MSIRMIIVSMAWAIMFAVTYLNATRPFADMSDVALWFGYLVVLTAVILWPASKKGERVEESGDQWTRELAE